MKKITLGIFALLFSVVISHAQHVGTIDITGNVNYQHLFMKDNSDAMKYSGGFIMQLGADYMISDTFYTGAALGFALSVITSEIVGIDSWTEIYDLRLPLHVGVSSKDRKFTLDTGPFIDFSVGGKTEINYHDSSSEKSTTRLRDIDVNRVALGWNVNAKVFENFKLGYGVILTDSAYGKGGDTHFISLGWAF